MPKNIRSSSLDSSQVSPYPCNANAVKRKPRSLALPAGNENEWEEARCSICMEHPHNAVLLRCSNSLEKGCRPYICGTSSLHSNCLHQFKKSFVHKGLQGTLVCPLCRGQVNDWNVVNPKARDFMNSKIRSCSMDICNYAGNYSQLVKHAEFTHPWIRPRDVDSEQELKWRNLEEDGQRQDVLSAQFDYDHEIDDEDYEEELRDGQDMDGEDVELRRDEIDDEDNKEELTGGQDMDGEDVELRRDEIDDEDYKEELTGGQDMDGEDVDFETEELSRDETDAETNGELSDIVFTLDRIGILSIDALYI